MIEQRQAGASENDRETGGRRPAGRGLTTAMALGIAVAAGFSVGALAQQASPPQKPDPSKAEKVAQEVCAACHGADGNSTAPSNPKIASQHPSYLYKQLKEFKVADGAKVAPRYSPVMTPMVANLSDSDMLNLAAFYAGKPLKPSAAKSKETVDLGQAVYRGGIAEKGVPACAGCHGARGEGIPAQYPQLHGQYADYTEAQLTAFRSGARANNGVMATIAARLSDREIKAVSDYVAGLR